MVAIFDKFESTTNQICVQVILRPFFKLKDAAVVAWNNAYNLIFKVISAFAAALQLITMDNRKKLLNLLGRRDYEKVSTDIMNKIEKIYNDVHKSLVESRKEYNESVKNIGKSYT